MAKGHLSWCFDPFRSLSSSENATKLLDFHKHVEFDLVDLDEDV